MAETTARCIAGTIIRLCAERDIAVTNLKLQKLLYYAQAWYLVFEDRPLFDDPLEAWVHGPVVAKVFGEYKSYRWKPIEVEAALTKEPEEIRAHIATVLDAYAKFDATALERLTHTEPPWIQARKGLPPDVPSRNVIGLKAMKEYYSSLLDDEQ